MNGVTQFEETMKRKASTQATKVVVKKPALMRAPSVVLVKRRTEERKNIDAGSAAMITIAQTTSNLLLLNGVDDGATSTTRIGRRITMSSLEVRFVGSMAATSAGSSPLRLTVVYDRQSNGAAPAATDVFNVDAIYAMMNLSNSRRFKVIIDELVETVSTAGPAGWNLKLWRDFTAKGTKSGLEVEFNENSTATITSIVTGSLYAFVWQNGNIITAAPTHELFTRVRFTDN